MRFCVLGPLEAYASGRSVAIGGGRQRALLALLLVHAGEIVSRDRLIDELWDGQPPPGRSQSLDVYISRLRKAFRAAGANDVLATRTPGYVLHAGETDARRFETLAAQGREALAAGEASRAAQVLAEALALWRGPAYAEVADEPWARAEAGRLAGLRLSATEDRIEAELALGHHSALVPELEVLVAREPTRERLAGQLMLALYRSGRQADALAAYRAARSSLVEELGLEPGPELKRLEAAVLAHDPALALPPQVIPQPATRIPGPRRRRTRTTLAGAAVLVAGTVIAMLALGGGTIGPKRLIAADGAGALDPVTGQIAASVAVGSAPAGVAAGAGSIWVTNGADGTVTRIDPRGPHVEQTLAVGTSPAGVAYGAGAVWVANALDGSVSRIDPRANQVVQTITIGRRPIAVTVGAGAVWVGDAGGDAVVPLDPASGVPSRPVRLGDSPGGVAIGFGALWVTEPLAHKLVRIDPGSGETLAEIGVGADAGPVAAGAGAVWVVNALDGTLSRVDPARNAVASTVPVGDAPAGVAADASGVWVADEGTGELVSVDPGTGTVRRRYAIGAAPAAITLLGGSPWIATDAPVGQEHRGGTLRVQYSSFRTLDPAEPNDVHPAIWRATGDGLVALAQASGAAQLVPDLATTVPLPTDGGRTYVFRLRPGMRYSTGVPVRASDLRRELERLYSANSSDASYYSALQGAAACRKHPLSCDLSRGVVTDDQAGTIILHLTRPDPELLTKARVYRPDVVVTDIQMPPDHADDGLRAALEIRAADPGVGVLVLSQFLEDRYAFNLVADGAQGVGYLLKEKVGDLRVFTDAVRRVAEGGSALDPDVVARLVGRRRRSSPLDSLTKRESEVLALIAEGFSNAGVAQQLVVTVAAVERHVTSIFDKLGLHQSPEQHRRVLAVLNYLRS